MTDRDIIVSAIDSKKELIADTADRIWEYAELSLKEYRSCDLYCRILADEGFEVKRGICGIETAFCASHGEGRPYIGILAEYDALSGLAQERGVAHNVRSACGDNGHGCGHNLLGAGAMAAAMGVKVWLEQSGVKGTVLLYGCPGEEGGAAKAFMARDREFEKLDAVLTWHPDDNNEAVTGSTNSCIQIQYKFKGFSSHASAAPEKGRSALDAAELMNIGVQFLREHMSDGARVHYAFTNAGGVSPNVVQGEASVLYMIRSGRVSEAVELRERVDRIAEGAAMMTDTAVTRVFIDGCADTVDNFTLARLMKQCFDELGVPEYTQEELEFERELGNTFGGGELNRFIRPFDESAPFDPGSTDVGDVSHLTPTAQIHVAAWPDGCPGHSWQIVSSAGSSVGHKAAVHAGKVIALTAARLYNSPDTVSAAREEFLKRCPGRFVSPIPADAVPAVPEY